MGDTLIPFSLQKGCLPPVEQGALPPFRIGKALHHCPKTLPGSRIATEVHQDLPQQKIAVVKQLALGVAVDQLIEALHRLIVIPFHKPRPHNHHLGSVGKLSPFADVYHLLKRLYRLVVVLLGLVVEPPYSEPLAIGFLLVGGGMTEVLQALEPLIHLVQQKIAFCQREMSTGSQFILGVFFKKLTEGLNSCLVFLHQYQNFPLVYELLGGTLLRGRHQLPYLTVSLLICFLVIVAPAQGDGCLAVAGARSQDGAEPLCGIVVFFLIVVYQTQVVVELQLLI